MNTKGDERRSVEVQIDVDVNRLYGTIDEAIAYLKEMKARYSHVEDFGLEEHWLGYEDMEMVFSYTRDETDEEMSDRIADEKRKREFAEAERERAEKRKRDLEDYHRLKRSLGL